MEIQRPKPTHVWMLGRARTATTSFFAMVAERTEPKTSRRSG